MATPFELTIQTELPKRPYMNADVAQESLIIRRGAGPRQLDGLLLTDGQVVGMVDGELVGIAQSQVNYVSAVFETAEITWTITHNRNKRDAQVTLRDAQHRQIEANDIQYNENDIVVSFAVAQSGTAIAVFLG